MKIKYLAKIFLYYLLINVPFFIYGLCATKGTMLIKEIGFIKYVRLLWPVLLMRIFILPFTFGGVIYFSLKMLRNKPFALSESIFYLKKIYYKLIVLTLWLFCLFIFALYIINIAFIPGILCSFFLLLISQYLFHACFDNDSENLFKLIKISLLAVFNNFSRSFTSLLFLTICTGIIYFSTNRFLYVYMGLNEILWKASTFTWDSLVIVLFLFLISKAYIKNKS